MEWAVFLSGVNRTSCEVCERIWQAYDKPTPCKGCKPDILEINRPFLHLYQFCSDQLLISAGGPVGLNLLAVDRAMDYFNIDQSERLEFYETVRYLSSIIISKQLEKQEADRKAAKR